MLDATAVVLLRCAQVDRLSKGRWADVDWGRLPDGDQDGFRQAARARADEAVRPPAWRRTPSFLDRSESVPQTRRTDRLGATDLIRMAFTEVVSLQRAGLILALACIGGYPFVLIAEEGQGPPLGHRALRLARHGVGLAARLHLPLICVVDTPGAELSAQAGRLRFPRSTG
jgi:acetyl-CoA carboxylase alpha subunit